MSSPSGAPKPNHDPGYELGDLELAPRPSLQTPQHGARKPIVEADDEELTTVDAPRLSVPTVEAHRQVREPRHDHSLDEFSRGNDLSELEPSGGFDHYGEDHAFELDLPQGDTPRGSSAPPRRLSVATGASMPPRPSRAPRSGSPRDEERAARELAAYGEPEEGLGAPAYVLRVGLRLVQLYTARRQIEHRAGELADRYEQALRNLGRALLDDSAVTQHEALRDRVLIVQTKQGELLRAEEATEAERAREQQRLAALQQKSSALEAELAPFREAERAALAVQSKHEAELKRRKAKIQRAEIELRAMTRASLPPPAERVQGVEQERAEAQREIDGLTAAHAEATAALGRARRELALRRGSLDGAEREQTLHAQQSQAKSRTHEEVVAKAEHALSAALCALAEAAETLGLAHSANEQVDGLRASEKALDDVVDELARYDRALTVYDRATVLRGSLMWFGLLVVLGILIRVW